MESKLIEKLALIYVEKNLAAGDNPAKALELFKKAKAEIEESSGKKPWQL